MAPAVRPTKAASANVSTTEISVPISNPLTEPQSPVERSLANLRRHIEANSEYVGLNFVKEARKMHAGTIPDRAIHGEARQDEARALIEEGVPVAPLPFIPTRRTN